jgi:thymidine phosphorylase
MNFKVKDMDIAADGVLIAILNEKDAKKLDLNSGDRIIVKNKKREVTCILDISESKKAVPMGKIGLFEEVLDRLKVKHNDSITLLFTGKPESVKHIRDKLFGKELEYMELYRIVDDISHDRLTAIEKTYFVSACFTNGLSIKEIVSLTKAMVETGEKLKFKGLTLDKHCIGGVPNNRTTMIVVPIIAAAGLIMPKTSSRAITSPAGTADTMECLTQVELDKKKIKRVVKKTKACIIWGGSMDLAPADDKIIDIEHPLSIDAEGQLLASVISKKASVTSNMVLIDIPMGKTTKIKNKREARHIKKMFEILGRKMGMKIKVIVTNGSQPIGRGVGPILEARDVLAILQNHNHAPSDLKKKSLMMAGILLEMAGKKQGLKLAQNILESGRAYKKMQEIINAQGRQKIPKLGAFSFHVKSGKSGKVKEINNEIIAKIARMAGAPHDKGSGLYLNKKVNDHVKKSELLYTIYAENKFKLEFSVKFMKKNNGFLIK